MATTYKRFHGSSDAPFYSKPNSVKLESRQHDFREFCSMPLFESTNKLDTRTSAFQNVSEERAGEYLSGKCELLPFNGHQDWLYQKRNGLSCSTGMKDHLRDCLMDINTPVDFGNADFSNLALFPSLKGQHGLKRKFGYYPMNAPYYQVSAEEPRKRKGHPSSNVVTLRKKQGLTSSMYNGVCFNKRKHKWRARISNNGSREFLGDFDTEYEAARAFDRRLRQLLPPGQCYDKLNFNEEF